MTTERLMHPKMYDFLVESASDEKQIAREVYLVAKNARSAGIRLDNRSILPKSSFATGICEQDDKVFSFEAFNYSATPASRKIFEAAEGWEINESLGLILSGEPGVGKTHVSKILLTENCKKNGDGLFQTARDLLLFHKRESGFLRDYYGSLTAGTASSKYMIQRVKAAKIFVIDDLGAEEPNHGFTGFLLDLVNASFESKTRLVINTNLDKQELKSRYGARIFDRITGVSDYVRVEGESYRQVKRCS